MADNPESYLMGIALRLWRNHRRREERRKRIAGTESLEERQESGALPEIPINGDSGRTPEEVSAERELKKKLAEFVGELKPAYRIPISLYYAGGKSIKDIAVIMKLPQGTVKRRLSQARRILRKKLEDAGYDG